MDDLTDNNTRSGLQFKTGVVLLVINVPFGYGGMAITAAIAAAKKQPGWLIAGGVIYGLSWLMLGLGILMAGPEGIKYVKGFRGKRLRKKAENNTSP